MNEQICAHPRRPTTFALFKTPHRVQQCSLVATAVMCACGLSTDIAANTRLASELPFGGRGRCVVVSLFLSNLSDPSERPRFHPTLHVHNLLLYMFIYSSSRPRVQDTRCPNWDNSRTIRGHQLFPLNKHTIGSHPTAY